MTAYSRASLSEKVCQNDKSNQMENLIPEPLPSTRKAQYQEILIRTAWRAY